MLIKKRRTIKQMSHGVYTERSEVFDMTPSPQGENIRRMSGGEPPLILLPLLLAKPRHVERSETSVGYLSLLLAF